MQLLSELGCSCSGSDLSPEMLKLAADNLGHATFELRQGDFRELEPLWRQTFDMVICMTTSFPHMLTDADALRALRSMYSVLNPGGVLVLSSGISDSLLDARPKFLPGRVLSDSAFYFFLEYPNADRIVFNILQVKKTEDSFEHAYESIEYNALRQGKLAKYFESTAFARVSYFGDFDFAPYQRSSSGRLLVLAKR